MRRGSHLELHGACSRLRSKSARWPLCACHGALRDLCARRIYIRLLGAIAKRESPLEFSLDQTSFANLFRGSANRVQPDLSCDFFPFPSPSMSTLPPSQPPSPMSMQHSRSRSLASSSDCLPFTSGLHLASALPLTLDPLVDVARPGNGSSSRSDSLPIRRGHPHHHHGHSRSYSLASLPSDTIRRGASVGTILQAQPLSFRLHPHPYRRPNGSGSSAVTGPGAGTPRSQQQQMAAARAPAMSRSSSAPSSCSARMPFPNLFASSERSFESSGPATEDDADDAKRQSMACWQSKADATGARSWDARSIPAGSTTSRPGGRERSGPAQDPHGMRQDRVVHRGEDQRDADQRRHEARSSRSYQFPSSSSVCFSAPPLRPLPEPSSPTPPPATTEKKGERSPRSWSGSLPRIAELDRVSRLTCPGCVVGAVTNTCC